MEEDSHIDVEIARFVGNVIEHPDTAAIYVLGNDLRNASRIARNLNRPKRRRDENGVCYRVYDGKTDLWLGIIPSAMMPNTNLDIFPRNTQLIDLEQFPDVFS